MTLLTCEANKSFLFELMNTLTIIGVGMPLNFIISFKRSALAP